MGVRRICVNRTRTKMTQKMIEKKPKRKIEKPNWKDECMADEKKSFSIFKRFNFLFFFPSLKWTELMSVLTIWVTGVCVSQVSRKYLSKKKKKINQITTYTYYIYIRRNIRLLWMNEMRTKRNVFE